MSAYYNEMDPYAAQWLRNLIRAGLIADGVVDERSIVDVRPDELLEFTQCHFFAGIGVWSHALRKNGWSDDRPIWTGSCPCQPFSAAGKQKGFDDERHLWPVWFNLIRECRPPVVLGEQVASALDWLDLVSADMEGAGYAFGASDLCAAGFGGAHIRQRLYFAGVADADGGQRRDGDVQSGREHGLLSQGRGDRREGCEGAWSGAAGGLADREQPGLEGHARHGDHGHEPGRLRADAARPVAQSGGNGRLADATNTHGWSGERREEAGTGPHEERGRGLASCGDIRRLADAEHDDRRAVEQERGSQGRTADGRDREGSGRDGDDWPHAPLLGRDAADWLFCRDGKWRPVEPGTFPLAHEATARVGRLRAYGNGLDAETAAQFCGAVMECLEGAA